MKSLPAASAISASCWQLSQSAGQRSGSRVIARPFEQFAPNKPSLSLLPLCMAMRSRRLACRLAIAHSALRCLLRDNACGLGEVAPVLELRVDPVAHLGGRGGFYCD